MLRKFIIFLVRKRLGLKLYEKFQFANQNSNAVYYFTSRAVIKQWRSVCEPSGVSLNWILNDECKIKKVEQ